MSADVTCWVANGAGDAQADDTKANDKIAAGKTTVLIDNTPSLSHITRRHVGRFASAPEGLLVGKTWKLLWSSVTRKQDDGVAEVIQHCRDGKRWRGDRTKSSRFASKRGSLRRDAEMQCDRCGERLVEIDHCGERITGCIECNRWSSDKCAFVVELSVDDFESLRNLELNGQQGRRRSV
jgi:hypothetical protein